MFLHLGASTVIPLRHVISIADIKSVRAGIENDFLKKVQKANKVIDVSEGHPKSFVVTDDYVYFSAISSLTLKKRAGAIPEEDLDD
jgi:hypothetical protein